MNTQRFHELLPAAYLAAAMECGGIPDVAMVGLKLRDIAAADDSRGPIYQIAMAFPIKAMIVDVRREYVALSDGGRSVRFHITYRVANSLEIIDSPSITDQWLGEMTREVWDRWEPDNQNHWIGKCMVLYKYDRLCIYAKAM